jgi:hypothetical protein
VDSVVVPRGSCVVVVELVVVPPEGSGVTVVVVELLGGGSAGGGVVVVVVVVVLPSEFTMEFVVLCASVRGMTAKPIVRARALASKNRPTTDLFISTSQL